MRRPDRRYSERVPDFYLILCNHSVRRLILSRLWTAGNEAKCERAQHRVDNKQGVDGQRRVNFFPAGRDDGYQGETDLCL